MCSRQNLFINRLAALPIQVFWHLTRWRMPINLSFVDGSSARVKRSVRVKLHHISAWNKKPITDTLFSWTNAYSNFILQLFYYRNHLKLSGLIFQSQPLSTLFVQSNPDALMLHVFSLTLPLLLFITLPQPLYFSHITIKSSFICFLGTHCLQ